MDEEADRRVMLSIAGLAGMFVAYLLALTVLMDTNMASKFENGVAPTGTDVAGVQTTVILSIVAAGGAVVASLASGKTVVAVLAVLAFVPFGLLSLITLGLAF
ncbi:hypothetical protein [Mycobacterium sp. SMC-4]|uniref:hypothetical protein n=1 Tax=Mycobacterium sp. SMC-4 TaxID=2857059 RepID=UPI003CFD4D4C